MKNRALTNEQKREICDRLYAVWSKDVNKLQRLGQLINNTFDYMNLYYVEDYDLIKKLEKE